MKKYLYSGTMMATSLMDIINKGSCGDLTTKTPDQNTIFLQACNAISGSINWVLIIAGFLAVLFVIYGGYLMLTSGGDSSKVENGKKMIIWAIVGIIVVALAKGAVYFVVQMLHSPYSIPKT